MVVVGSSTKYSSSSSSSKYDDVWAFAAAYDYASLFCLASATPPVLDNDVRKTIAVYFSFGRKSIRRGKVRNMNEILMMLLVHHQLLCERSSILSSLLILFFPLVPSVVMVQQQKCPSHSIQYKAWQTRTLCKEPSTSNPQN